MSIFHQVIAPIVASIIAIIAVFILRRSVLSKDEGSEKMARISKLIQEGAAAFLRRQYRYVAVVVVVISILIAISPLFFRVHVELGWQTALAFLAGALASAIAGFSGMYIATRANARTTQAAATGGFRSALDVAISGGAVMGLSVVGVALLGLSIVYWIAKGQTWIVNGYAMGASLVALFARCGGGIYTKGADMGADLVGKVEAGIPEDDPRNPAVIADNVGDNVGDVAGLGADLLESYVESIVAAIAIVGVGAFLLDQGGRSEASMTTQMQLMRLPLLIAAWGIVASIIGVWYVKTAGSDNPQTALMNGTYLSAGLAVLGTLVVVWFWGPKDGFKVLGEDTITRLGPFWATVVGIVSGVIVAFTSEYFTSSKYGPVKKLAESSQTGAAVNVTGGLALGMMSTALPTVALAIALVVAYKVSGMYGVALASLGMLATTGMVVSVDSYGPIADNAGGIAEMAELDPSVRKITDNLDSVGNTTAAISKGFAIGSAAFAALGLLAAFLTATGVKVASLTDANVLAGLLIGAMFPYLFSSLLFGAVIRVAYKMIEEVRRQFKENPGIMKGTAEPDSARCVDISTKGAIKGMILPGLMAIITPVVIGLWFGPELLAGVLTGALACGLMLGIQTANSGGALDNAKKYIEEGHFGGKGSETHKAAVVGDTVGDPLKDTVGPSINILIKLMAVISLVLAPLFI